MVTLPDESVPAIEGEVPNPEPIVGTLPPAMIWDGVDDAHAAPDATWLPDASILTQLPEVCAPVVVTNAVVFPLTVPTLGTTPAPPPITGKLAVRAAELANVPAAVYANTPPLVPDAIPVPPFATGAIPETSAVKLTAANVGAPAALPCSTVVVVPSVPNAASACNPPPINN